MTRLLPLARNPDVVSLTVQVDGEDLPATALIQSVVVSSQVNRIPYARLRLVDGDPAAADFRLSAGELFLPGNEISVLAGYHGETEPLFVGLVTRQRVIVRSDNSWLEVECREPVFKMALTRRNRHFEEVTDSDVADTLLAEYGLEGDITATEVTHPMLLQFQATDWDFMVSRLEANGQLLLVDNGRVSSLVPALDGEPEAEVLYGATLLELDAQFDARTQAGAVKAMAWDPAEQTLAEAEAADPAWEGNGDLETETMTEATGREQDELWHGGSLAADALQAWADGSLLRSRLAASRGRARFQGLPSIKPGSLLDLAGLGDRFNGTVYVTGVRHEFCDNDWRTDIEFGLDPEPHAERFAIDHQPAAGLAPAVSGLQIGVVTELADDPLSESRIRVRLPLAGADAQGVWARVATLDAGDGRGTFFRPEVGDEVVLGFLHGDPVHPVVLGMLHSSAHPPPLEATADNHQKAYVSRSGIQLLFDDDEVSVSLETPEGNKLTLTDADGGILLEDQNGNKLTMDANGIAIESAAELSLVAASDLKAEGLNTELTASANFKAEGSAGAEVSSSAVTTIKGSLVQIN